MTRPRRKHHDSDLWSRFNESLSGGSGSTRAEQHLAGLSRALAAICPPGKIHCVFQDGDDSPPPPAADVSVPIEGEGGTQAWITWSGEAAERNLAQAMLAAAAERLPPVLTAWSTLRRVSGTDPLTGAGSRRALDESLAAQLRTATRHHLPFSILMLDADDFKSINDTRGHAAGDQALTTLADWLRRTVRENDQLYRYGGDEFVLLLPHTDAAGAYRLAKRIRGGAPIPISTGIADTIAGDTPELLLERADKALLEAKEAR